MPGLFDGATIRDVLLAGGTHGLQQMVEALYNAEYEPETQPERFAFLAQSVLAIAAHCQDDLDPAHLDMLIKTAACIVEMLPETTAARPAMQQLSLLSTMATTERR